MGRIQPTVVAGDRGQLDPAVLDHVPVEQLSSQRGGGQGCGVATATRGRNSQDASAPLPTPSYGLCSVSDRYVRIKLQ